jgi:hypothetical protein
VRAAAEIKGMAMPGFGILPTWSTCVRLALYPAKLTERNYLIGNVLQ